MSPREGTASPRALTRVGVRARARAPFTPPSPLPPGWRGWQAAPCTLAAAARLPDLAQLLQHSHHGGQTAAAPRPPASRAPRSRTGHSTHLRPGLECRRCVQSEEGRDSFPAGVGRGVRVLSEQACSRLQCAPPPRPCEGKGGGVALVARALRFCIVMAPQAAAQAPPPRLRLSKWCLKFGVCISRPTAQSFPCAARHGKVP